LPVENGYAGSIHENLHYFLRYDYKIIGEYDLKVNHCILSLENDISKIKEAYSHPQALSQVHNFLQKNNIVSKRFADTA
jgi:prephenate dehydratase